MKYTTPIALLAALLLAGCATVPVGSNNSVVVPEHINLTADNKPIEKMASLVGQTFSVAADKMVKGKDGSPARKIDLKSEGLLEVVKWFVVGGGLIMVAGLFVIFLLHKIVEGLSALGLGFSIVVGTLLIKAISAFLVLLAGIATLGGFVWLGYVLYRHRKDITAKNILKVAADVADDGKLNDSVSPKT